MLGLLARRELDGALGLTEAAPTYLRKTRGGRNVQHELVPLLRQSVYSRLAGYGDTNDAVRLARDPAMQAVVGRRALEEQAASTLSRFETEVLVTKENLKGLNQLNAEWVDQAMMRTRHQRIILDMDSCESPVYGEQEGAAYSGYFGFRFGARGGDLQRCGNGSELAQSSSIGCSDGPGQCQAHWEVKAGSLSLGAADILCVPPPEKPT